MTTWIDVVDTVAKIGLGGLIGGLLSAWLQERRHDYEQSQELLRRHRDSLEDITGNFENCHGNVGRFVAAVEVVAKRDGSGGKQGIAAWLQVDYADICEGRRAAVSTIEHIEGRLFLMGFVELAQKIQDYRMDVVDMGLAISASDRSQAVAKVKALDDRIQDRRRAIYDVMKCSFLGPDVPKKKGFTLYFVVCFLAVALVVLVVDRSCRSLSSVEPSDQRGVASASPLTEIVERETALDGVNDGMRADLLALERLARREGWSDEKTDRATLDLIEKWAHKADLTK